jgi:hypothetical protein
MHLMALHNPGKSEVTWANVILYSLDSRSITSLNAAPRSRGHGDDSCMAWLVAILSFYFLGQATVIHH